MKVDDGWGVTRFTATQLHVLDSQLLHTDLFHMSTGSKCWGEVFKIYANGKGVGSAIN